MSPKHISLLPIVFIIPALLQNQVEIVSYLLCVHSLAPKAQARCHRIGQLKAVKVYRLITRNTYEKEMFDRASLKLGLDKAVLQSMGNKEVNVVCVFSLFNHSAIV